MIHSKQFVLFACPIKPALLPAQSHQVWIFGKFDKEMSYGDATKECEKLIAENEEKTFWPEKSLESKEGFRFP